MISSLRNKQKYLIALLVFLTFLHFISSRLQKKQIPNFVDKIIILLASPLQGLIAETFDHADKLANSYIFLVRTKYENDLLTYENQKLKDEIRKSRELQNENKRLRELLGIKDEHPQFTMVQATIIAKSETSFGRTLRINKGAKDNIIDNLAVLNSEGAVGRTIRVTKFYSDVLLITDPNASTDALCARSRANGIVKGRGKNSTLDMVYVEREADVEAGDVIITSGFEEIWPKGVHIGEITKTEKDQFGLFQKIEIKPYVNFSRLEDVLVILQAGGKMDTWEKEPHENIIKNDEKTALPLY